MKSLDIKSILHNGKGSLLAALAIIVLGLQLGTKHLNDFPAYAHAWAQSDWYAIALGFRDNGYDLFHPQTMIYNKQFPGLWCKDFGDTVTSADFPIHEYIVALLMTLFGSTAPWVFRGWTLLCSLAGLWFLFLLCRRLILSWLKALAVVIVAITSPLYAYYFANFLPSAPALALVMAGLWSYVKYWQEDKIGYWHLAIGLLSLGAMTRTSQAVALVAVGGFELLRILREETTFNGKWPAVLLGGLAIGGYLLWNSHLRAVHGSIFLNHLMPPRNWEDVQTVWLTVAKEQENGHYGLYFGLFQQWLMIAVAAAALVVTLIRHRKEDSPESCRKLPIALLAAIWTFGELLFVVAMWRQFSHHDYYFLDCLWLPVLFWIALALKAIPVPSGAKGQWALAAVVILASVPMYNEVKNSQKQLHTGYDMATDCYENYLGSDRWLDSLGVSRDARILSFLSYPQNSPFILMERKGYSIMWQGTDANVDILLWKAAQFDFDYMVVEDYMVHNFFDKHRYLLERTRRIGGNQRLSLCRLSDTVVNNSADDFFNQ